jgi:hypothetical protein
MLVARSKHTRRQTVCCNTHQLDSNATHIINTYYTLKLDIAIATDGGWTYMYYMHIICLYVLCVCVCVRACVCVYIMYI